MADLEKVIKGLELCLGSIDNAGCPEECPYYEACQRYENYAVFQPLMRDALEALKAKEPEKPIQVKIEPIMGQKEIDFHSEIVSVPLCGNCGYELDRYSWQYCPVCGKAVKWEHEGKHPGTQRTTACG